MIRLGLRLAVAGGREAVARLILIMVAVAIGVALLLTTLAALNAVTSQNDRYAWLESSSSASTTDTGSALHDPLWWRLHADYYQGHIIARVDLAATGPDSPIPLGLGALPSPGQFYASPALTKLLRNTPPGQLADRFDGSTQVGVLGDAALPAPNSLIIVIGHATADVAGRDGYQKITSISTTSPAVCSQNCLPGVGINSNALTLILAVVVAALLFPILIFIGGATRLSAARREQRFAAMRLIGATPRQIAVIATVESTIATLAGVIVGFGLFFAARPATAMIPFTGDRFFTSDLSLSVTDVLVIALGIPLAAALAARIALRRVNISPLGVTRRVTPTSPRAWRVIPALAGIAWMVYLAYFSNIASPGKSSNSTTQAFAYLIGALLIMAGLVIAGPWLTLLGSRFMARTANRPSTLIAARRLADNPQAGFRAVSGLVLALFVGTCAVSVITAIVASSNGSATTTPAARGTLFLTLNDGTAPDAGPTSIPTSTMTALTSIPGVTGVTTIRQLHNGSVHQFPTLVASCAQLAATPVLGRCPTGAQVAQVSPDFAGSAYNAPRSSDTLTSAAPSLMQLQTLPVNTLVVATNATTPAVEQARTTLGLAYPATIGPQTISELHANQTRTITSYQRLADVVILVSLPIAGCSLAVAVAGGLAERKRPFSLLRLTGTPLRVLQRIITLETAGPLLTSAVVSIGAGLLTAQLFLRAQLHEDLQPLGLAYYLIVLAGVAASLAVLASTLPLLKRVTGPETARNE